MIWWLPWIAGTAAWPLWWWISRDGTVATGLSLVVYGIGLALVAWRVTA